MGFLNGLKDFGVDVGKNVIRKAQRLEGYKLQYESLSRDELMHEYHRTSDSEKKMAIRSICKDRGYIE